MTTYLCKIMLTPVSWKAHAEEGRWYFLDERINRRNNLLISEAVMRGISFDSRKAQLRAYNQKTGIDMLTTARQGLSRRINNLYWQYREHIVDAITYADLNRLQTTNDKIYL